MKRTLLALMLISSLLLTACGTDLQGRLSNPSKITDNSGSMEFYGVTTTLNNEAVATFQAPQSNLKAQAYEFSLFLIEKDGTESTLALEQYQVEPGQSISITTERLPTGKHDLKACYQFIMADGPTGIYGLKCQTASLEIKAEQ